MADSLTMRRLAVAGAAWLCLSCVSHAGAGESAATASQVLRAQSGDAVSVAQQGTAQAYWSRFRAAVVADDMRALGALTARPLVLKGAVDTEEPRRVPDSAIATTLRQQLAQPVFQGVGKAAPTLAQLVRETDQLPTAAWRSPQQIRIHNLELRVVGGQWKLTTIYSDE
jgi:hypothetical protein